MENDALHSVPRAVRWIACACTLVSLAGLLWFAQQGSDSGNTHSRLATIESLADYGTFFIDQSRYIASPDKVMLDGRFISTKPPVLPVIGAILYKPFSRLTGITFQNNERKAVLFVSLTLGVIPYLVLLLYFYRFLLVWVRESAAVAWGYAAISLNFIAWGYATGINNHTPAAAAVLIAFYYAFLVRSGRSSALRHWILAGLFAGLAPTLSPWASFFSAALTVYLATADMRRTLSVFIPASLPFMLLHVGLTYAATGSVIPIYLRTYLYYYPGSFWEPLGNRAMSREEQVAVMGFEAVRDPRPLRYVHFLIGHHGLVSMTPVFLLSFWILLGELWRGSKRRAEAVTVLVPVIITIGFLGWRTYNYGGMCGGFRWMIFAMPLLFLFAATWIERYCSRRAHIFFAVLVAVGMLHALDILRNPWQHSTWHRLFMARQQTHTQAVTEP